MLGVKRSRLCFPALSNVNNNKDSERCRKETSMTSKRESETDLWKKRLLLEVCSYQFWGLEQTWNADVTIQI